MKQLNQMLLIAMLTALTACGSEDETTQDVDENLDNVVDEITGPDTSGGEMPGVFVISGSITGQTGEVVLTLSRNNQDEIVTVQGGDAIFAFTTEFSSNDTYSIELTSYPSTQQCVLTNATGVTTQNITNVQVVCESLSGFISNISGHTDDVQISLTLDGNLEETIWLLYTDPVQAPANFDAQVVSDTQFEISVVAKSLHQACEVAPASGTTGTNDLEFTVICEDVCDTLYNEDKAAVCKSFRNTHNEYRELINTGTVAGANGNYPLANPELGHLTWNETLAEVAQEYADQCTTGHNSNRQSQFVEKGGENVNIGENIAYHSYSNISGKIPEEEVKNNIATWWEEHSVWDYQVFDSNANGAGHFTQIIWANTTEIGCGLAICPNYQAEGFTAYLTVCDYKAAGNYFNQYPYQIAE